MGADAAKTHETFSVSPSMLPRASDAVDLRDDRPAGAAPLTVDATRIEVVLHAAGVTVGPQTEIRLRLRAQAHPGEQGSATRIGPDVYRVVISVADKPALADRHLYVVNNSLLCRPRHSSDYADLRIMPTSRSGALASLGF